MDIARCEVRLLWHVEWKEYTRIAYNSPAELMAAELAAAGPAAHVLPEAAQQQPGEAGGEGGGAGTGSGAEEGAKQVTLSNPLLSCSPPPASRCLSSLPYMYIHIHVYMYCIYIYIYIQLVAVTAERCAFDRDEGMEQYLYLRNNTYTY